MGEHTDRVDPLHCSSLLTRGTWLDENHRNWQPEGVFRLQLVCTLPQL